MRERIPRNISQHQTTHLNLNHYKSPSLIACVAQHATLSLMIKTFKHKGLEELYRTGTKKGIQAAHANKLRMQLVALDTAFCIEDLDIPGYRLHPLKGDKKGLWSIVVNANWRITFEFRDGHVFILNYEDYH